MPVRAVRAEDLAAGGGVAGGGMDWVTAHRCRRPVRVSLPAARMGKSLPVRGFAVSEEAEANGVQRTRAIPVVRHTGIQLSGVRYRPRCTDRRSGGVLPATRGGGESDQRSQ